MHLSAPLDNGLTVAQKVRHIYHVTQNPSPGGSPGWEGVGVTADGCTLGNVGKHRKLTVVTAARL